MHTLIPQLILHWAHLFHWASMQDFVRVMAPGQDRLKAVEYWLPRLVKRRQLKAKKIEGCGNKLFYALPGTDGRSESKLEHGLKCTDALVRFHLSEPGEYVSERDFRAARFNPVPELAVRYEGSTPIIILFEYSTPDNAGRGKLVENKLRQYLHGLARFRAEFEAEPYLVYVLDAPEWEVEKIARRWDNNNFYFTDARQFYSVPLDKQLEQPIYLWRGQKVSLYV